MLERHQLLQELAHTRRPLLVQHRHPLLEQHRVRASALSLFGSGTLASDLIFGGNLLIVPSLGGSILSVPLLSAILLIVLSLGGSILSVPLLCAIVLVVLRLSGTLLIPPRLGVIVRVVFRVDSRVHGHREAECLGKIGAGASACRLAGVSDI